MLGPRLAPLDKKLFHWILTETALAQYINPQLDPADRQAFAEVIGSDDVTYYAKMDCSGIETDKDPLPGVYVVPTITLLRQTSPEKYEVSAIKVGSEVFTPTDGAAWELARYFVIQGLQLLLVVIMHPRLHFPCDAINTISQMTLPRGHLLYRLLIPHTTYTLGLHEAVIHHRRSVIHNSQREIYTPFPIPTGGIHDGVARGLQGIEGNSSYSPYEFGCELLGTHTAYGRFRKQWFEHILAFTSWVTNGIPKDDIYIKQWADYIHQWLPSFPDGYQIFQQDRLAWTTALYIANVSVFHTGDHYSYTRIPLKYLPFRLRQPGPHVKRPEKLDLNKLVSREDFFRHQLCRSMFFKPVVLASLKDVRYYFRDNQLKQAETEFISGFDSLDQYWLNTTFPTSDQIAVSLQY
jgi:hypothetical protein